METHTKAGLFSGATTAAGVLGLVIAVASGADTTTAITDAVTHTADRFGLWPTLAIALVVAMGGGLFFMTKFVMSTMLDAMDDHTLSNLHLARKLGIRPCLKDSDVIVDEKALEDDAGPIGEVARRVLGRRDRRRAKKNAGVRDDSPAG